MFQRRVHLLLISFLLWSGLIWGRFYYWQAIMGNKLATQATSQTVEVKRTSSSRGKIYSSDKFPLVLNENQYSLYAWLPELEFDRQVLADELVTIFRDKIIGEEEENTNQLLNEARSRYFQALDKAQNTNWVLLEKEVTEKQFLAIKELGSKGLNFEIHPNRFYPEASMSAHLLGFLGRDKMGLPQGYFGLEGFYDRQLRGHERIESGLKGVFKNLSFLWGEGNSQPNEGRNLHLNLDRTAQYLLEQALKKGVEKYGARSGWAVILNPQTGGVIAMSSQPDYHPGRYQQFEAQLYPNPVVANTFEPGSIIKPLIAAAALEEKAIKLEDKCDICSGPITIGEYQIETWNSKYFPDSTIKEILEHSDNVGMVWTGNRLGVDNLLVYFDRFGFGRKTGIDLQEEVGPPLRSKKDWSKVDLATASFGQGIAVTPIQMVTAFAALANRGERPSPRVVAKIGQRGETWTVKPVYEKVISLNTAEVIKEILVGAVDNGEAKWAKPKGFAIAGKTGTAQIPIQGHYDEEKTIASFVGFAPADQPKFVMLVSLREPTSSPWGAETAAPLWFAIAEKLFYYYGIAPARN